MEERMVQYPKRDRTKDIERQRRKRAENPSGRAHEKWVQRRYGLEPGQYAEWLSAQDGRCAICMQVARTRRLAVDHDHFSGLPRGALLCYICNRALSKWEGDPIKCYNAIQYLWGIIADLGGLPEPEMS